MFSGTKYLFRRRPTAGGRVRYFEPSKEPLVPTIGLIVSRSVHDNAHKRQLHSTSIVVSESGYTGI